MRRGLLPLLAGLLGAMCATADVIFYEGIPQASSRLITPFAECMQRAEGRYDRCLSAGRTGGMDACSYEYDEARAQCLPPVGATDSADDGEAFFGQGLISRLAGMVVGVAAFNRKEYHGNKSGGAQSTLRACHPTLTRLGGATSDNDDDETTSDNDDDDTTSDDEDDNTTRASRGYTAAKGTTAKQDDYEYYYADDSGAQGSAVAAQDEYEYYYDDAATSATTKGAVTRGDAKGTAAAAGAKGATGGAAKYQYTYEYYYEDEAKGAAAKDGSTTTGAGAAAQAGAAANGAAVGAAKYEYTYEYYYDDSSAGGSPAADCITIPQGSSCYQVCVRVPIHSMTRYDTGGHGEMGRQRKDRCGLCRQGHGPTGNGRVRLLARLLKALRPKRPAVLNGRPHQGPIVSSSPPAVTATRYLFWSTHDAR